jgi:hypothetical protein
MGCAHVETLQSSGVGDLWIFELDEGEDDGTSGPALWRHLAVLLGGVELRGEGSTVPARLCMEEEERTRVELAE